MNRKADLDRLAQLHDEDLHQVVKAVEWVIMRGEANLQRQGLKIVAMVPSSDPAQFARERRDAAHRAIYSQRGELLFQQEYPSDKWLRGEG